MESNFTINAFVVVEYERAFENLGSALHLEDREWLGTVGKVFRGRFNPTMEVAN